VTKESDGMVPGNGTRVGEADTLVGLGARQRGAIGGTWLSRRLNEALVEAGQVAMKYRVGFG